MSQKSDTSGSDPVLSPGPSGGAGDSQASGSGGEAAATAGQPAETSERAADQPAQPRRADLADLASAGATAVGGSRLDRWMAENPWHVRFAPFMAYIVLLAITGMVRDLADWAFIPAYIAQCGITAWLLWRYRRLIPEMNLRFHWSALPVGVAVCAAWVGLGYLMIDIGPESFADPGYIYTERLGPALGWSALALRLLGMSIVVPLFEEVFHRSLTLRSFSHPRWTAIGAVNLLQDLPLIDEVVRERDLARRAGRHMNVFAQRFHATPLGRLTVFGVAASTAVFCLAHAPRDWPACIVCGVAYCLLVGYTNNPRRRLGLGPVIWAHGITNALLWAYAVYADAWYFLP